MSGFGAVIPALPVHLREDFHANTFVTGFLIGLSSGAALLGRLIAGRVADQRGRRLALAIGLALCEFAGFLYLPFFRIGGLSVARLLHGLGEGFFLTAAVAWAVDLAPPDRRSQALGFLASGVWGGVSVGPLIGQILGSWARVSWFVALSSLLVVPILHTTSERRLMTLRKAGRLVPRASILPGFVLGFANVAYAAMAGFLILLLRERGVRGAGAFTAFALMVLFARITLGSLPDRLGPRKTLFAGLLFLAAGLTAIALSSSAAVVTAASAVVGLGYSFPWPSLAVVVVRRADPSERASALGALTAFYDIFVALGSLVAGGIASRFGLRAVFWMALSSVACSAVIAWVSEVGQEEVVEDFEEAVA